jgi:glycosyltransferase involved in cell wall biosynthesis
MTASLRRPSAPDSIPRRILYVEACEDGTVGGSHQALYDLVCQLDRRRFTPVVLFYQANRWVAPLRELGVEVLLYDTERHREKAPHLAHYLPGKVRSMLMAPIHRTRLLRRLRIDLLHLNNSPAEGYDDWLPAARVIGVPCVAHAMGTYRPPRKALGRWAARQHDRVIAISRFVEDTLTSHGMPAERIVRIPLGVDVGAFRARVVRDPETVRSELGVSPDTMLAVMVGNIRHWKGQDVVLAALALLTPGVRARLHVAFAGATAPADSGYRASLESSVREYGLMETVSFLGARRDIPDLMCAADVVVHASRVPEPFGIVVVEGLALGKPVLATHFGGPVEVLTPECGRLYDPAEPGQLAALLSELACDAALRRRLGASARNRAPEFDASKVTRAMEQVYASLLGLPSSLSEFGNESSSARV